ncbi:MAG TPA: flavodoxin family protein [Oscillospiraceae bacterium]|nr:flavodoxin family protein [Oscillospiraceae bacterium]HPS34134.1 flavodoxin family protein [Oscillospiraceae bacterium]
MKTIIIVSSYHHKNTEKVAKRIAEVLGAQVVSPQQIKPLELQDYDLIGFGSGIYDAKHHLKLLELADHLPPSKGKRVFLFSTDGMPRALVKSETMLADKMREDHKTLREKLQAKGYVVAGEFGCAGFNTNSLLKLFGGINKGRPNENDLSLSEAFARKLK